MNYADIGKYPNNLGNFFGLNRHFKSTHIGVRSNAVLRISPRRRHPSSLHHQLLICSTLTHSTLTITRGSCTEPCPRLSVLEPILPCFLPFLCRYHYRCTWHLTHRPIITHSRRITIARVKMGEARIYWSLWHPLAWFTSQTLLPPIIHVVHTAGSGRRAFLWWRLHVTKQMPAINATVLVRVQRMVCKSAKPNWSHQCRW